jgi:hypothetical protein
LRHCIATKASRPSSQPVGGCHKLRLGLNSKPFDQPSALLTNLLFGAADFDRDFFVRIHGQAPQKRLLNIKNAPGCDFASRTCLLPRLQAVNKSVPLTVRGFRRAPDARLIQIKP